MNCRKGKKQSVLRIGLAFAVAPRRNRCVHRAFRAPSHQTAEPPSGSLDSAESSGKTGCLPKRPRHPHESIADSLIQTAKENGLNPRTDLEYLFDPLPYQDLLCALVSRHPRFREIPRFTGPNSKCAFLVSPARWGLLDA